MVLPQLLCLSAGDMEILILQKEPSLIDLPHSGIQIDFQSFALDDILSLP